MLVYTKASTIYGHTEHIAWESVTMRPIYPLYHSTFEEGLNFIFSYVVREIIRSKRDTYSIAIF